MARKILFHYSILNMGGAEMSMLRMMRLLAEHGWEVHLVLSVAGGKLEAQVDPRVKITHLRNKVVGQRFFAEKRLAKKMLWMLIDGVPFLLTRLQWLVRALRFRFRSYDVAAIGLQGLSPSFCCRYVKARKRLHWIRSDLSRCDSHGRIARNIRKYKHRIDRYVCVSGTACDSLVGLFPELESKAIVIHNVIDPESMRSRAEGEANPYDGFDDSLKVVTVCRMLDQAKGLFRMLEVHCRLREEAIDFQWFLVGDGPDFAKLEQAVLDRDMTDRFILVGVKENPFPYYRHADVSATLSHYEGLCGAVNEAKIMGRPVIATRFSGIQEQISDGVNGMIVENNEDAICDGMKRILADAELRQRLTNDTLPEELIDDDRKIRLLEQLVEERGGHESNV